MIAPAPLRSSLAASLRRRSRSFSSSRRETPDALAVGRVDHVATGDREVHGEPRALGLERILDHLDDDLLAGLEHVRDLAAVAGSAPAAPRGVHAREHDLVDVQKAVLLQPDVDERRLEPGQDVVDPALVDVADDRAVTAALQIELGDSDSPGRAPPLRRAYVAGAGRSEPGLRGATVPVASSSATRVSPRSTLTSTCFFNFIQSFGNLVPQRGSVREAALRK